MYIITWLLVLLLQFVNGIDFCNSGLYINVDESIYEVAQPLETIGNNYIQIDCN